MENEKTSAPRRVRDDETQVLDEGDLLEIGPVGAEAVDRGWTSADELARTRQRPAVTGEAIGKRAPVATREPETREPETREREPETREAREPAPVTGESERQNASPAGQAAEQWVVAPVAEALARPHPPADAAHAAHEAVAALAAEAPVDDPQREDRRWAREADALAASQPTRAALLLSFRARTALDLGGDVQAAEQALARAASLAPDARFVALTRRWIAEHAGEPSAISAAARAEIPLAGDALERSLLLWQIAGIEQHATGSADGAERALREAIALDAQDLGSHLALAALAAREQRWRAAAEAWETAAARTDDRVARAALYTASASARECFLDDEAGARGALERAVEADPGGAATLAALESLHLRRQSWADYARLLVLEAERVGDLEPGLAYHERAGDVLWECLGDGPAAAASYDRAAALAPGDVVPLGKLAALYEQEARYPDLVPVYEQLAAHIADPTRRAGVLLRLGTLYESRLDRPDDALRSYQRALESAPTLAAAAQALAAHFQARGRWAELTALLLVEADRLTVPAQRAARYTSIAEQREAYLGASDDVVALYERALALDPGQAAALDALDRIYRARERWHLLAGLYEQQLGHARDAQRTRALRLSLAALYHERLAAPERAATHLRAVLAAPATSGDFTVLSALARALADAGQWADHVDVLEQQAAALTDEEEVVATLHRTATVIENRLHDPRRALAAYERVLERAPGHAQALDAILRLQRGQSRWEELCAAERRLLETTERAEDAAAILYRIGQVAEEHLGHAGDAIAAYEEALARLPSYRLARVGLERLLRAGARFDRLAELLEQQASADDPIGAARVLCQAALLREMHPSSGGEPDLAAARALYEGALSRSAGFPAALWGLCRIGERSGDWAAVAGALEALARGAAQAQTRSRLLVRLARVAELRLNQPARAAELYGEALEAEADPAAIFDRLRVALGDAGPGSAEWLERAAAATDDARLAAALLRLRASAIEHGGGRGAAAAAAYEAALLRAPDPRALDGLARNLPAGERDARLPAALAGRARLVRDAPTRGLLLAAAGALYEGAERPAEADGAYEEALAAIPDFLPALAGRRRLRELDGDWGEAAAICAAMAAQARDPENKVDLFEQAALLCLERLGDVAGAVQHYRSVLAARPGHRGALQRTMEILEQSGDWAEAVAMLSDQVEAIADDETRADLLGLRARILAERLGDAHAAISDIERAGRLRPDSQDQLRLLAELHEATGHWADAALAFERLAAAAPDPEAARAARLAQARIWIEAVPDYPRAQRILEEVVAADPGDRSGLTRLAEIALRAGDGRRATEIYRGLAESGAPEQRAAGLLALADLQAELGDEAAGQASAGAAFDLAADAPQLSAVLEAHYRARGDLARYADLADAALGRMALRAAGALPLRLALARVLRTELGSRDRALENLKEAARGHPKAALPRVALAEALAEEDPDAAIAELRRIIEVAPTEAAAYGGLAAVCLARGWPAAAALMATAAELLGGDPVPEEIERGLAVPARPSPGMLPPEEALRQLVGPTQSMPVREILDHLDPYLPAIFPDGQELVAMLEPLAGSQPAAAMARGIAMALAVPSVDIYRGDAGDPLLLMSEPRALALGPDHLASLSRAGFDAASALSRLAAGSAVGQVLEPDRVQALLRVATDPSNDPVNRDLRKRLSSAMPRRARKDMERTASDTGVIDQRRWAAWEQEERRRARRAGVVFCRDLRAVAASLVPDAAAALAPERRRALIASSEPMLDALRFAASDACWSLCRRLFRGA